MSRFSFVVLTICAVFILSVFSALSYWQYQRLQWKQGVLADIHQAGLQPPVNLGTRLFSETDDFYKSARAQGRFIHDRTIFVGPKIHDGEAGFHVVTPLRLDSGDVVLVNRGWRAEMGGVRTPETPVDLGGLIMPFERPNMFTPENNPSAGLFYTLSAQDFIDLSPMPFVLYADVVHSFDPSVIGGQARINIPNNHAQYMGFWAVMALLTILFYTLMVRRRNQR